VAVLHRNAVRARRDRQIRRHDAPGLESPQDPGGLALDLGRLVGDVGQNVAQRVERGDARIAGPRDRLQGRHQDLLDAEGALERSERQDQLGGGAVGVGQDPALPAAARALDRQEAHVIRVDPAPTSTSSSIRWAEALEKTR
jgi:hypothetical protein